MSLFFERSGAISSHLLPSVPFSCVLTINYLQLRRNIIVHAQLIVVGIVNSRANGAQINRQAWRVLAAFERPSLTVFSDKDPISKGGEEVFQQHIKGAHGQPHVMIRDAGHFLQEEKGPEVARIVVDFMKGT